MDSIINIRKVTKKYNKTIVLDNVSLNIKKGTIMGLIGENGAGKTTLMKSILGLIHTDDGEIIIEDCSLRNSYSEAVKNIGFLLEPSFYNYLSAYGNMKVNMIMSGLTKKDFIEIDELLQFVGLYNHKDKKVNNFSFGMKQRLGLAQALIGSPQILILDEPMVGMDPVGMKSFKEKILELHKKGTTILFSSHQLDSVKDICSDLAVIKDHKIIVQQKIDEVICNIFSFEFERDLTDEEINNIKFIENQVEIYKNKITIKSTKEEIFLNIASVTDNKIVNYTKVAEDLNKFF